MSATNSDSSGQPLFIVDRDWLRQGSKARKSWTGNVRNRSLYGLAIQVTQSDVPGAAARTKSQSKPKRRRRDKQSEGTDSESQGDSESSHPYDPSLGQIKYQSTTPGTILVSQNAGMDEHAPSVASTAYRSWPENPALHPPISSSAPYTESIRGLECYLDYYLDVIGTNQHPIETRLRFRLSSDRSPWFPLAYEDDLWLQNIALFSALHHTTNLNGPPPEGANALMSSFLMQLNERISKANLSDSTIASVSCLTLGEHIKGNEKLAKVHALGMAEMVRLRGGLHTIERARRAKIVRADIIRSADTLDAPLLQRLPREPLPPTSSLQGPSLQLTDTIASLSRTDISSVLISILWTLGSICESLEAAWADKMPLDTSTCHEHILCLNHDLLEFDPRSAFDEALKLSLLNFTQPMFRYCAFTEHSCRFRTTRLRSTLEHLYLDQYEPNTVLWVLFTGYMTSQQTDECSWFKARLDTILRRRQIPATNGWHMLKACLQKFLWTESIHDELGKHYYEALQSEELIPPPPMNNMCVTCGRGRRHFDPILAPPRDLSMSSANSSEHCLANPCPT